MNLFESGNRYVGICNSIHPKGHEERTKRARTLFRNIGIKDTNTPSKINIYVEWFPSKDESSEGFFYYSNYKEADYKYTRKAIYQINDVKEIIDIILDNKKISDNEYRNIDLYVNPNIILSDKLLDIGNLEKFHIRLNDKEVLEVRKKRRKSCTISYEDPCKDKKSDPEKYSECRNEMKEINFDSIIQGIINGLASSVECALSPDDK